MGTMSDHGATSGSTPSDHGIDNSASGVPVDTTNFAGNLTASETDVQKALDKIDDIVIGGGGSVISTPDDGEVHLTPKASSTGVEGTIFYCSTDNQVYVATE